ncbi:hypothetical protein HDU97_006328 [Phlyctochytrium planicorne]|nr:hypothetical protein HDU97_006328 [Phlyctochytrium planicorne]
MGGGDTTISSSSASADSSNVVSAGPSVSNRGASVPRSLSNSMKAALSDPHLNKSLKDAPRRPYNDPNSPSNTARIRFEKLVRRIPEEPDISLAEDPLVLSQLTNMSMGSNGSTSNSRNGTPNNGSPMGSPNMSRNRDIFKPSGGAFSGTERQASQNTDIASSASSSSGLSFMAGLGNLLFRDSSPGPNNNAVSTLRASTQTNTSGDTAGQPNPTSTLPIPIPQSPSNQTQSLSISPGGDLISPQASRPFLFSLLSSSPFASIFRTSSESNLDQLDVTRARSANPLLTSNVSGRVIADDTTLQSTEQSATVTRSTYDYLGLGVLGRIGSEASASLKSRAKSLLDLPSLLSSSSVDLSTSKAIDVPSERFDSPAIASAEKEAFLDAEEDAEEHHLSLVYLTLPLLEKAIATYRVPTRSRMSSANASSRASSPEALDSTINPGTTTDDPTFLVNTIRTCFSSSDSLNKSFLLPNVDISSYEFGLDIESIRTSYSLILALEPKQLFERTLINALEILLASLELNIKSLQSGSPRQLRQFFAVLENPLLYSGQNHETLLKKLCLVLGKLRTKSKQVLLPWLASYDTVSLQKFIKLFQDYISGHFFANAPKPDDVIICAIKNLSLLYYANEASGVRISISSFYNETLNRKLNFKDEYRNWKKILDSKKITEFSFFNYPFLFDPVAKTRILHIDAMVQMSQEFEEAVVHQAIVIHAQKFLYDSPSVTTLEQELKGATNPFLVLEVRRQHLVKDVLDQIRKKEKDMKKPLKVKFVGGGEEGMDQGGVQKEFFQVLVAMLLDPAYGMFTYEEETRYVWINGASLESEKKFELVGTVIGLALYNGVILGVNFPRLLYKKLLDEEVDLEDIKQAFPALGKGLQQLLDWNDGDVGDIFLRSFEISYDVYGQMCRAEELELLICGTTEIDFKDLERGAGYDDGYNSDHVVIKWLWEICHAMPVEQKKKLLMFVTASDRVPLKGLGNLTFVVQRNGPDTDRLPTALTCFGRLLLPEYASKEKLENRLITAIENAKGFGCILFIVHFQLDD